MLLHPRLHHRRDLPLADVVENLAVVTLVDLPRLVGEHHILVEDATALYSIVPPSAEPIH